MRWYNVVAWIILLCTAWIVGVSAHNTRADLADEALAIAEAENKENKEEYEKTLNSLAVICDFLEKYVEENERADELFQHCP